MLKCLYGFSIFNPPDRGTSSVSAYHDLFSFEGKQNRDNVVVLTLVFSHVDKFGVPLFVCQGNPIDTVEEVGPAKKLTIRRYRRVTTAIGTHDDETIVSNVNLERLTGIGRAGLFAIAFPWYQRPTP